MQDPVSPEAIADFPTVSSLLLAPRAVFWHQMGGEWDWKLQFSRRLLGEENVASEPPSRECRWSVRSPQPSDRSDVVRSLVQYQATNSWSTQDP